MAQSQGFPCYDRRHLLQQVFGLFPANAAIGDGNAILERRPFLPGLLARVEVALQHQPHQGPLPRLVLL